MIHDEKVNVRFLVRYYDAKEVIHKRIAEIEKISQNLGPNFEIFSQSQQIR